MRQTAVLDLLTEAGFQAWVTQSASPQRTSCTFLWSGLLFKTIKAASMRELSMFISLGFGKRECVSEGGGWECLFIHSCM